MEDKSIQTQMAKFDAEIAEANIGKLKVMMEAYELRGTTLVPDEYANSAGKKSFISFLESLPEGEVK